MVGTASNRPGVVAVLQQFDVACSEVEEPYAAIVELARRPLVYRMLVLSLASLFKEELPLIAMVKGRLPHIEVWLTHTDGRAGMLAEAMRLGADGLLSEEGLHRTAAGAPADDVIAPPREQQRSRAKQETIADEPSAEPDATEPVLTADELRALLQEQPDLPQDEP